ncbi:MAG: glycosyl hydrolase family 43 [Anaerolineae bacterium]
MNWVEGQANPLIQPPFPSLLIADPTFLPSAMTPDQQWHLFAHSLMGIHHFTSPDGNAWTRHRGLVSALSLRPFLFIDGLRYYLFYEKVLGLNPFPQSRMEVRVSTDLWKWSAPTTIMEPSLPWHREGGHYGNVGNPCVIRDDQGFRLYYSAGLVYLKDCRFCEPKYIGIATSPTLTGHYLPRTSPILQPDPDDPYMNLGAGAIKVVQTVDGYVGFQNGIYWDPVQDHSGSAIRLLHSPDGDQWTIPKKEPILKPGKGWKKSHVYALDIRRVEGQWRFYFNARSGWLTGREGIGYAIGTRPEGL